MLRVDSFANGQTHDFQRLFGHPEAVVTPETNNPDNLAITVCHH